MEDQRVYSLNYVYFIGWRKRFPLFGLAAAILLIACVMIGCADGFGTGVDGLAWGSDLPPHALGEERDNEECRNHTCYVGLPGVTTFLDDALREREVLGYFVDRQLGSVEIVFKNEDLLKVARAMEEHLGKPPGNTGGVRISRRQDGRALVSHPVGREWEWQHRDRGFLTWDDVHLWLHGEVLLDPDGSYRACPCVRPARLLIRYQGSGVRFLSD